MAQVICKYLGYEMACITRIAAPMLIHFGYELRNKNLKWGTGELQYENDILADRVTL